MQHSREQEAWHQELSSLDLTPEIVKVECITRDIKRIREKKM